MFWYNKSNHVKTIYWLEVAMSVHFSVDGIKFVLGEKLQVKKWVNEVVRRAGKAVGEINYRFCSDDDILGVNISYLNHDTYTDIITFDYVEGDVVSGDILISIDRVRDNAQKYAVTFEQELHRVMIHGVLHLLGNGDKSEKEAAKMRQLENAALKIWDGIK